MGVCVDMKTCCCCINLRTGSLIIGYLHVIFGFCVLLTTSVFFIIGVNHLYAVNDPYWFEIFAVCSLGLQVVLGIISLGIAIALIYGLHKNISKHLRSYLIFNVIFTIYYVFELFLDFLFIPSSAIDFIIDILAILLTVYFLLVIRSYWLELRMKEKASMYPAPAAMYPMDPTRFAEQPPMYTAQPAMYPSQPAMYPSQPAVYPSQTAMYPAPPAYSKMVLEESVEKTPIY